MTEEKVRPDGPVDNGGPGPMTAAQWADLAEFSNVHVDSNLWADLRRAEEEIARLERELQRCQEGHLA